MKQPRCALVTAVEVYTKNLCELKLDTAVIPKEIGECSVLHTMKPKHRKVTCVAIMKRVADHGINTGRLGADMKDASVFFRSPELPQMIEEFVQVHKATGAVATSRTPLLRAIRLATYLNAVDAAGTAAASTCIQSALSAYRQYRSGWKSANRSRAARTVVQDWNLDLLELVNQVIMAVHDNARRFWGHKVVETTAEGFQSLIRMCHGCSDIGEKAKLRRQIVGVHLYLPLKWLL